MRLFGSDKMLKIADVFGLQEDDVIEHKLLSKSIENAQKKVEANNFSIRNRLLEYDQPMNEQREIIYRERKKILMNESMEIVFYNMLRSLISRYVDLYTSSFNFCEEWQLNNLNEFLKPIFKEAIVFLDKDSCTIKLKIKNNLNYTSDGFQYNMLIIDIEECSAVTIKSKRTKKRELYREVLKNKLYYEAKKIYKLKEKDFGEQQLRAIERMISLKIIDQHWMEHIDNMSQMRQSVSLRAYAQRDPAIEYKQLSYTMFDDMNNNIQQDIVFALFNVRNIEIKETDNNNATTDEDFIDDKHDNIIDFQKHRKIGRNDLCPCGSGKKYKNCCGKLD
jgi:preprotein translocase subunit SecA